LVAFGRRVTDWLAGRHEFRALVEVEPERGVEHGGRPVPGTNCVEFVQVGVGSRASARIQAVAALRARMAVDLPHARVLALLDGAPPAEPDPRLHLLRGRPALLLVEGDGREEVEQGLDRVVSLWQLPEDRYSARQEANRDQHRRRILGVAVGAAFGAPLLVLVLRRLSSADLASPFLPRFGEGDPRLLLTLIGVALLPGLAAAVRSWRQGHPNGDEWWTANAREMT